MPAPVGSSKPMRAWATSRKRRNVGGPSWPSWKQFWHPQRADRSGDRNGPGTFPKDLVTLPSCMRPFQFVERQALSEPLSSIQISKSSSRAQNAERQSPLPCWPPQASRPPTRPRRRDRAQSINICHVPRGGRELRSPFHVLITMKDTEGKASKGMIKFVLTISSSG